MDEHRREYKKAELPAGRKEESFPEGRSLRAETEPCAEKGALSRALEDHSNLSKRAHKALCYLKGRFQKTLPAMRPLRSGQLETPANSAGK